MLKLHNSERLHKFPFSGNVQAEARLDGLLSGILSLGFMDWGGAILLYWGDGLNTSFKLYGSLIKDFPHLYPNLCNKFVMVII